MEFSKNLNLQFCENCKLHYFPDVENNIIPSECRICRGILIDTGVSYEEYRTLPKTKRCSKCKRKYPKLFIKCPKCDNQLTKLSNESKKMDRQMVEIRKQTQEFYKEQQNIPKCPTCQSTDVQKLSTMSKVIGIGLLGLASKTVGKTYKCNKCGYYW